jgi:hypothetical protein
LFRPIVSLAWQNAVTLAHEQAIRNNDFEKKLSSKTHILKTPIERFEQEEVNLIQQFCETRTKRSAEV